MMAGIQPTVPDFQADQTSPSPTVLFRALFLVTSVALKDNLFSGLL